MQNFSVMILSTVLAMSGSGSRNPSSAAGFPGSWEGESICTVPSSPCHDEHVIYEIKAANASDHQFTIDAYKIIRGEKEFMGTLQCRRGSADSLLSCTAGKPRVDNWEFVLSGDRMTGTLKVDAEKTLYRKIHLKRILSR